MPKTLFNRISGFVELAKSYPAVFFCAYAVLLISDLLILRENALIREYEVYEEFIPRLVTISNTVKAYGPVGWLPDWGGGIPLLTYPLLWWRPEYLFALVVPPLWAYAILYAFVVFFGGWGTFLFLRYVEDYSLETSLIGGLIFASFPFFVPGAVSLTSLPLFLYCFDRLVLSKNWRQASLPLLGCFLYLLSCNIIIAQPYVCIFHFTLCCYWLISGRHSPKSILFFIGLWALYLLPQVPHIATLWLEFSNSSRSKTTRHLDLNPIQFFYFVKTLSFNVFTISLMALGLVLSLKDRKRMFYAFWFLAIIPFKFLWASASEFFSLFKTFQFRINWIYPLLLTFLFSSGLESLWLTKSRRDLRKAWGIAIILTIVLSLFLASSLFDYALILAGVPIAFILYGKYRRISLQPLFPTALLLLVAFGLASKFIITLRLDPNSFRFFYHNKAIELLQKLEAPRPSNLYRVVGYGVSSGVATYHGIQTADMHVPFVPLRYQTFWSQVQNLPFKYNSHVGLLPPSTDGLKDASERLSFNVPLLALINVKYVLSRVVIENPRDYGLEALLEESMVSCKSFGQSFEGLQCGLRKYLNGPKMSLYKIADSVPRFFTVHRTKVFDSDDEMSGSLRTDPLPELRRHLYVTKDDSGRLSALPASPDPEEPDLVDLVELTRYEPEDIRLTVDMKAPGYLVMTENYSERWFCTDNGSNVPILPAYGAFRAIGLAEGRRDVVCRFSGIFETIANRF